jgi:hypothetical protein
VPRPTRHTAEPLPLPAAFNLSFTQSEVDFVVPDLAVDLRLGIDPFLLFKSRDPRLQRLHTMLISLFDRAIQCYRDGDAQAVDYLIDFPEVNEIGFGYTRTSIGGSGLGRYLNRALADILGATDALRTVPLRHVEELQLLSPGIGPDRVSDVAANILKRFLVEYTQEQAALWHIPLSTGLPVAHYFDAETQEWADGYFDLPRNPVSGGAILLVPRRVVRHLPWINYNDYVRTDFKLFLPPTRQARSGRSADKRRTPAHLPKSQVVNVTRHRLELMEQYVTRKEREAAKAQPAVLTSAEDANRDYQLGEDFVARLSQIPTGPAAASTYQRLVYEILNYCFEPELTDGKMEPKTLYGTERRDITYLNEADSSFWEYVRSTYQSMSVMFELKNVTALSMDHVNQTATYLGTHLGMLGFIVTRNAPDENIVRKLYAVYHNTPSMPRKVILVLSDADLIELIRVKQHGQLPTNAVQHRYRLFIERAQ